MAEFFDFDPQYPHTLPKDWKEKNAPSVYEIMATLNTLRVIYEEYVEMLENNEINKDEGEDKLRQIATNYQSIKQLLFQGR